MSKKVVFFAFALNLAFILSSCATADALGVAIVKSITEPPPATAAASDSSSNASPEAVQQQGGNNNSANANTNSSQNNNNNNINITINSNQADAIEQPKAKPAEAELEKAKPEITAFTDSRDNKQYKSVKIGRLVWMAENLNYSTGRSWCYDKQPFNCEKYGRLYDWQTANDACPRGWHLPSKSEWEDLIQTIGEKPSGKLRAKEFNGTDDWGFSAMLGGRRDSDGGYDYIKKEARWWASTEKGYKAYYQYMDNRSDVIEENMRSQETSNGYSVRCVKSSNNNSSANSEEEQRMSELYYLRLLELEQAHREESLRNAQKPKEATFEERSVQKVSQVVKTRKPDLKGIYNKCLELYPNCSGKITLSITIAPSGDISKISILSSTTSNTDFDNAIKNAVAKWKWEAISGEAASYTLPLNFPDK